jgi:ABC-2 type transport system ATP-binding protein
MNQSSTVSIHNLSKDYGSTSALSGVDLNIPKGSVVGVLGPNGSGKTTLLKHIAGLTLPSRGSVKTFAVEAAQLSEDQMARIGYVSQESELLDSLTVAETIDLVSAHHTRWDGEFAEKLLKDFKLEPSAKVGGLSVGQKQRLSIILGVCHGPDLLLLDEPAASLDPIVRQDFLDMLMDLMQDPERTILISSHILSDVEKVIDRVLIIDEGSVHCFQPLDDLREQYHRIHLSALAGKLPPELPFTGLKHLERDETTAVATVYNVNRSEVEKEAEALQCRYEIRPLDFQEIYRLVVAGK